MLNFGHGRAEDTITVDEAIFPDLMSDCDEVF